MKNFYTSENNTFSQLENKLIVPRYQRSLVWSTNDKKQFIETLHNGFPFGSILIYKYENEKQYSLIDGLQRYSTIKDFKKNPEKYIDFDEFRDRIYHLIIKNEVSETTKNNFKRKISKAINDYIELVANERRNLTILISNIVKEMDIDEQVINEVWIDIYDIHENMMEFIDNYINVEQILIPTVVFNGDMSSLATVFQNLNKTGKKLSKYQVFAASWSKLVIKLSSDELNTKLLDQTIERYNSLIEVRELEIEDYSESELRQSREINLSELCYAIGKLILNKMEVFWDSDNDDLANQIGHSTLAIVLNVSNKKIANLSSHYKTIDDSHFLENMVKKILEIFEEINTYFSRYFKVPGTSKQEYYGGSVASDLQVLSIFGSLWNVKYGPITNNQHLQNLPRYGINYNKIKTNLIKHFIVDSVTSKWVGTGDTKLDEIIIEGNVPYIFDIPRDTMNNLLFHWHNELLKKKSERFEPKSRMLYTVLMSYYHNDFNSSKYDKEHVISKNTFSSIKNYSIPGGSIGNLMYLDVANNRSKGKLSLYDALKEGQQLSEIYTSKQSYPTKEAFERINSELQVKNPNYEVIVDVIKTRGQHILNDLMNKLYKS